jgi:hypothetical protein
MSSCQLVYRRATNAAKHAKPTHHCNCLRATATAGRPLAGILQWICKAAVVRSQSQPPAVPAADCDSARIRHQSHTSGRTSCIGAFGCNRIERRRPSPPTLHSPCFVVGHLQVLRKSRTAHSVHRLLPAHACVSESFMKQLRTLCKLLHVPGDQRIRRSDFD